MSLVRIALAVALDGHKGRPYGTDQEAPAPHARFWHRDVLADQFTGR